MQKALLTTAALALLAIFMAPAQAAIHIGEATIQNGQVFIAGNQAPKKTAIFWETVAVGTSTNSGGAFKFNATDLPADCVGRLKIGTAERDVVINNCTPRKESLLLTRVSLTMRMGRSRTI